MATFRHIADIEKYTKEQAHKALEEVAQQVFVEWKGLVKKRVYDEGRLKADPSNDYYKRTNQFLECLELQWLEPLKVVIGYNTDKILPSMMIDRYSFNRHTSFSGQDVSHWIPTFIEEGNGDSKIYAYEGLHIYDEICKNLTKEFHMMMEEALLKQGLPL